MKKVTNINERTTEVFYPSVLDVMKDLRKVDWSGNSVLIRDAIGFHKDFHYFKKSDESFEAFENSTWSLGTDKLKCKLNELNKSFESSKDTKLSIYDICGYQASVPRYLQGIPTSMINSKLVKKPEKVINVIKHIGFLGDVKVDTIIENSAKALAIITQIEKQGIRCNLDVLSPAQYGGKTGIIRIRIKNASERTCIGKLAYPIANPDMLRRVIFAIRKQNNIDGTWNAFSSNYASGSTIYNREENIENLKAVGVDNFIFLNNFITSVEDEIKKMNA